MGAFVEDSGGFMNNIGKQEKDPQMEQSPEIDNWIPGEAYQVANDFRSKHGNDLSPELIQELLRTLNTIWRDREKKQIRRIKSKCSDELNTMRRQMKSSAPYSLVHLRKTVANLSTQLTNAKKELKSSK